MRKAATGIIIVATMLAGCASPTAAPTVPPSQAVVEPTSTKVPTAPSPTATPTQSATATSTSTPSATATPQGPTELAYTVSVVDGAARTIHVLLQITGLARSRPVLTFWTNAREWSGGWLDPWTNTANIQATDSSGNSVPVSIVDDGIDWTGDGLLIEAQAGTSVTAEYDVVLGFLDRNFTGDREQLKAGYMNSDFAVAEPEFLLLAPADVETGRYAMTLRFDLPEDQVSVSHWVRLAQHTYSIDAADKAFSNGAIAFGHILSQEQTIGQTSVRAAAYGIAEATFAQIADYTFRLYRYYDAAVGPTSIPAFVVIYEPDVTDNRYLVPYNENTGGFFMRYLPWDDAYWSGISHGIAHNWLGGGMGGDFWFGEGFATYYQLKSCESIGVYPHSFVQAELAAKLARYTTEILGTENDLSLTVAEDRYGQDHGFPNDFLVYEKASLVAYLLDLRIAELSEGQKSLDDVMAVLWSRYGPGTQEGSICFAEVQAAVEQVTGQNFAGFFDTYLEGTRPLPLEVQQGEVVMTPNIAP